MNCTDCSDKICIKQQNSCSKESFKKEETLHNYHKTENKTIVDASALLVDNGRAGTLSRIDEICEFAKSLNFKKIGIAYCYGMEKNVKKIESYFKEKGFEVSAVSCSVGGLKQSEVNETSCIHKVSCNPIGQANQLNSENVDLTVVVGICLGHDILLNRNLNMDFTTLVVKDRVFNHNPLKALETIENKNIII